MTDSGTEAHSRQKKRLGPAFTRNPIRSAASLLPMLVGLSTISDLVYDKSATDDSRRQRQAMATSHAV